MNGIDISEIAAQSLRNDENPFVIDPCEILLDALIRPVVHLIHVQAMNPDFQGTYCFEERSLEITIDAHDLSGRLHLRAEGPICIDEFIERPTWEFHDTVIECRLKAGLCLLSHRIRDFIKGITDGNLCGDFGNRIAGRLRCQSRGAAHAGIDFDDIVAVALRIERVLRVAATFDTEFPDDAE